MSFSLALNRKDILVLLIINTGLYVLTLYNYVLFHSLAETFATIILGGIFFITWGTRKISQNSYLVNMGIGFLFVGLMNLVHIFHYNEMAIHCTCSFISQWIAMQYLLSLVIVISPLIKHTTIKIRFLLTLTYTIIVLLELLSIYHWDIFPSTYNFELKALTPFKIYSEYIIILVLLFSLIPLYHLKEKFDASVFQLLVLATIVMAASEYSFTLYSLPTDLYFTIGHLLKIITFYLFYKAFIHVGLEKPYDVIFKNLRDKELALQDSMKNLSGIVEEKTAILQRTNEKLKKEVEQHARSEKKFISLFETSPQPIVIINAQGAIVLTNNAACRVFGYEENEMVGNNVEMLIPDHLRSLHIGFRSDFTKNPHSKPMGKGLELVARRKLGHIFPIEINLSPWRIGAEKYTTALINDISERKLAEDILRRKNLDLKKKNKELDNFIYSISHDIRSPISTLMGLINIFALEIQQPQNQQVIQKMDSTISRLDHYIRNIIIFADVSHSNLFPDLIEFEKLIHTILKSNKSLDQVDNPLEIILEVNGDYAFYTDEHQLEIILDQLIANAFRFRKAYIDNAYLKITINHHEDEVLIVFEDNGIGIHDSFKDKIFNMYFRANYSSVGSGLGLYIVKESVEKLHGEITFKSELDKGATFTVKLPNLKEPQLNDLSDPTFTFSSQ